jgi:hypothetical protein
MTDSDFTPERLASLIGRLVDQQSRAAHVADDALVATTGRVLSYARASFAVDLENLLDDPSDLLHPWRALTPPEYLAEQRRLAHDLGLDYDGLIEQLGTPDERQRLRDIESGVIQPAPREAIP